MANCYHSHTYFIWFLCSSSNLVQPAFLQKFDEEMAIKTPFPFPFISIQFSSNLRYKRLPVSSPCGVMRRRLQHWPQPKAKDLTSLGVTRFGGFVSSRFHDVSLCWTHLGRFRRFQAQTRPRTEKLSLVVVVYIMTRMYRIALTFRHV